MLNNTFAACLHGLLLLSTVISLQENAVTETPNSVNFLLLVLAHYVPNVAKEEYMTPV